MTPVLHRIAERGYVRNGYIDIVRIKRTVQQGGLSAFADAGGNPLAGIDVLECRCYCMQVAGRVFGGEVLPVLGFGGGFEEITVFHEYHIGIEQLGQLFAILGIERIGGSVSFGNDNRGAVEATCETMTRWQKLPFPGWRWSSGWVKRVTYFSENSVDSNGFTSVIAEILLSFCCKAVCADRDAGSSNANSRSAVQWVRRLFIMRLFRIGHKDSPFSSSANYRQDKKQPCPAGCAPLPQKLSPTTRYAPSEHGFHVALANSGRENDRVMRMSFEAPKLMSHTANPLAP